MCKVHPRTGYEGPEVAQIYSYTLSLTSALDGGVWSTPHPGRFTPGNYSVPIMQEAGCSRAGLDGYGKSPPPTTTGVRSLDRPAPSKSLHRLRYPGPHNVYREFPAIRRPVCVALTARPHLEPRLKKEQSYTSLFVPTWQATQRNVLYCVSNK